MGLDLGWPFLRQFDLLHLQLLQLLGDFLDFHEVLVVNFGKPDGYGLFIQWVTALNEQEEVFQYLIFLQVKTVNKQLTPGNAGSLSKRSSYIHI